MFRTLTILSIAVVAVALLLPVSRAASKQLAPVAEAATAETAPALAPAEQSVDLVICLDTSGSMSGLIESAKQKLWAIVNELGTAEPRPKLRVALYHYGNSGLDRETGYVKQLCPLTDDLDTVYDELFKLTTNGGEEYVARVVRAATVELDWSDDPRALKLIYVAGNEPATQDPDHPLETICRQAIEDGIVISTIFCGPEAQGIHTGWKSAADWAEGTYAAIDADHGTVVVNTPYDAEMATLSSQLNETYLAFGHQGLIRGENQRRQDANAQALAPAAAAGRAVAKASVLYEASSWDLVDASKDESFDLDVVAEKQLPEEMQSMSEQERRQYIAAKAAEREQIQQRINELNEQRDAYVREQMEKQGLDESSSFDAALRNSVRELAVKKGFAFPAE